VKFSPDFEDFSPFFDFTATGIHEIRKSKIFRRTHKFNPSIIKDPDRLGNPERLNTIKTFFGFFRKKKPFSGIIVTK
jgi:hypothetical protein